MQGKPNYLTLEIDDLPDRTNAFASGWFDAVAPDFFSPDRSLVGHTIWSIVARQRFQQNPGLEAEAILLRGLAAGSPEAEAYSSLISLYLRDQTVSDSRLQKHTQTKAMLLYAGYARCAQHRLCCANPSAAMQDKTPTGVVAAIE